MIWHLFQCGVEDDILNIFEEFKGKRYRSKRGLHRLLNAKGIEGKKVRKQCLEGALVGFISETILRPGQVLLSDRAGQFAVFDHAACWIHPLHNNDSERDLRGVAKRRKLSGSTKSALGRKFRDGLMSLKQTCFRLNLSFWDFSIGWCQGKPLDLAKLVAARYKAATV